MRRVGSVGGLFCAKQMGFALYRYPWNTQRRAHSTRSTHAQRRGRPRSKVLRADRSREHHNYYLSCIAPLPAPALVPTATWLERAVARRAVRRRHSVVAHGRVAMRATVAAHLAAGGAGARRGDAGQPLVGRPRPRGGWGAVDTLAKVKSSTQVDPPHLECSGLP